ncbi:YitT family protein [uncultured Clostridium sp.]|uniref:YitT family protein n=1 Tax=uncultured Clostridium sp. TaxID=59620 RepID=UPI00258517DE|nr:YitT family protein [uncultured Clostridium sp.]MDU1347994.1 YitT family protein [Clostridium argentinense]
MILKGSDNVKNKKKLLKEFVFITIGLIFIAAGLYFFLMQNNLAAGGVSGLAIIINKYIPVLNVGVIMLGLDTILYIIGFIFIGASFGFKSIYCSLTLAGLISIFDAFIPMNGPVVNDIFLNLVFGILVGAIGMAIVFNQNASTGGTDIIAKILNKYLHIDIGKGLLITDFTITVLAIAAFGPVIGMYSLLGVIINGFVIDYIIGGLNIIKKVEIVSEKGLEIQKFIIEELERGATLYDAKGAYTLEKKEIITTVLGKKEFLKLKNFIKEIDPKAFIITYHVHEILGNGFTRLKD